MDVFMDWLADHSGTVSRVILLITVVIPVVAVLARTLKKTLTKRISAQVGMLASKFLAYTAYLIIVLMLLREFGVKLTPLLGAAGVVGIAVGFAAQTSLSNLISGVFLILERPFAVGDLVRVDQHTGLVHSIDLLSIQLRTFDNTLIRLPNETMLKSAVTTITAFPIRRMDIPVGVAYKEDVAKVMALLRDVADSIPECLDEPEPFIIFKGFGESALEFTLGVWFAKEDYVALRNALLPKIKKAFDEAGIEIPFPHRTLYAGSATGPLPIRVVDDRASPPGNATDSD